MKITDNFGASKFQTLQNQFGTIKNEGKNLSNYNIDPNATFKLYAPVGCEKCNNTGYLGRVAIYEVMPMSEKLAKLVVEKVAASDIQKEAMTEGMLTMKQDGYVKVLEGVTTMEEVVRVAQ